jgi:hypothetical protein
MAPEPNGSKAAVEGTKKKRNRKKKTKTGPKEEKAPVVKEPQNALNPAILLRNKLIANEGFSQVQIDKAMEEMWDEQLPYDEYESVFKYLKSGAKAFAQAQAVPLLKEAPTKVKAALVKEMAAPTPEPEYEDGDEEDSGVEESKEIEESTTSSDAQSQISMASKLDMVAGFENLTDGAFALTEWVAKVAKPHEVRIVLYYEMKSKCSSGLGGALDRILLREEDLLSLLCWYPFLRFSSRLTCCWSTLHYIFHPYLFDLEYSSWKNFAPRRRHWRSLPLFRDQLPNARISPSLMVPSCHRSFDFMWPF